MVQIKKSLADKTRNGMVLLHTLYHEQYDEQNFSDFCKSKIGDSLRNIELEYSNENIKKRSNFDMKRKWTESEAIQWLNKTSDLTILNKRVVLGKNGLGGLKACSAFDYLRNHCGYK